MTLAPDQTELATVRLEAPDDSSNSKGESEKGKGHDVDTFKKENLCKISKYYIY